MRCEHALHTRYEDLLTGYDAETARLVGFLRLEEHNASLGEVIEKYRPESVKRDQKGLHFSHGKIGRFRQKMTPEQKETLARAFASYLGRMGYPV